MVCCNWQLHTSQLLTFPADQRHQVYLLLWQLAVVAVHIINAEAASLSPALRLVMFMPTAGNLELLTNFVNAAVPSQNISDTTE